MLEVYKSNKKSDDDDNWRKIKVTKDDVIIVKEIETNAFPENSKVFVSSKNDLALNFHNKKVDIYFIGEELRALVP